MLLRSSLSTYTEPSLQGGAVTCDTAEGLLYLLTDEDDGAVLRIEPAS
jgi:hypothetical protein